MSPATYQTVKLSQGKHISPEDGACVMELASMLAGEPFSDHPRCACPVIASFLRAYNDSVEDSRRQDLYAYASQMVGTRSTAAVQRARGQRLATWELHLRRRHWTRRLLPERLRGIGLHPRSALDAVGIHAVHAIGKHSDATHAQVLALIDELLTLDTESMTPAVGRPVARAPIPPAVARS
jgi:hypothetical protein